MSESVTFLASLAPIQSAIKVGDDGLRFVCDVPESELANALALVAMRGRVLKVTVEVAEREATWGGTD